MSKEIPLSDFASPKLHWVSLFLCENDSHQTVCFLYLLSSLFGNATEFFSKTMEQFGRTDFFFNVRPSFLTYFLSSKHFLITDTQTVKEKPSSKGNEPGLDNF